MGKIKILVMRAISAIIFVSLCVTGLTGCSGSEKNASEYDIYYTNNEGFEFVTVKYSTEEAKPENLLSELLSQMNSRQKSDDTQVIKPDYVSIDNVNLSNGVAYITYNKAYYDMNPSNEVMYRSGVVKTLTQIAGVDYVFFYVEDLPVQYNDGSTIGMMTASDFIDDNDNNVNNLQWTDLNLYFANSKGDRLVKDTVSVAYSKSISMERLVVEQLINGSDNASYSNTLPKGLKLLSISVSNQTCYVNFDNSFLTEIVNVSREIPIYSVVNSLCELSNIDNVQILVNGDSKKLFRESISLETPFSYNRDIVYKEE